VTAKTFTRTALALSSLAVLSAGCGEFVRSQGRSPSQVAILSLEGAKGNEPQDMSNPLISDVETLVTTPAPCTTTAPCKTIFNDLGAVTMSLFLKDAGAGTATTPSPINAVTFTRYRVVYRRVDGRSEVPAPIDSGITFTVPASGPVTAGFELVRHAAKMEAPLRALRESGETLATIADVTFYGRDQAGNDVSVSGSIGVNFGNFAP